MVEKKHPVCNRFSAHKPDLVSGTYCARGKKSLTSVDSLVAFSFRTGIDLSATVSERTHRCRFLSQGVSRRVVVLRLREIPLRPRCPVPTVVANHKFNESDKFSYSFRVFSPSSTNSRSQSKSYPISVESS